VTVDSISASEALLEASEETPVSPGGFRFDFAAPQDNAELLQFSAQVEMPGAIRFWFDRSPDYLAALQVEGRQTKVLVCRNAQTGRLVAAGHRAVKMAFVNGEALPIGYLSGLRVAGSARSPRLLSRGYAQLRALNASAPAQLHLTTIMEDNPQARKVLLSRRLGLPAYHDFGRFCCMAVRSQSTAGTRPCPGISLRCASESDGAQIVRFLNSEGGSKQFFPQYCREDFGNPGGLLRDLHWQDIFLAFRGERLIGCLAAWDQRAFRRWRVAGYVPWVERLRIPLNLVARCRGMPLLPKPNSAPTCFVLSLVCVQHNDREVFSALLQECLRVQQERPAQERPAFFLAGLHERDPLLPELLARPHVALPSRLYVVAWPDGESAFQELEPGRTPYLELGAL